MFLFTFLVDEGRGDPNTAISGIASPSLERACCVYATNAKISYAGPITDSCYIRIYHECKDRIENLPRGSPFGSERLVE